MKRHGYITKEEADIAEQMTVDKLLKTTTDNTASSDYRAFIDTVIEEVKKDTGKNPYVVPMEIYTTIDPDKQNAMDKIMSGETFSWENDVVQGGILVLDVHNGEIKAVGAGRNRVGEMQYNTATMINKQIGSTSKPIYDYAPGIEYQNWSTYTPFIDEPHAYTVGGYINNWDRRYNGFMSLRTALAQSRNIPALKAFQANENSDILKFVTSLGLSPEVKGGVVHEAHSIGGYTGESPLTMAAAYQAFSNGGYYITPHSYTKVIFSDDNSIYEKEVSKTRVMSEETAYMMTSLLRSSAQYGLGAQYNIGGAIYGAKTGTSNYAEATIRAAGFGSDAVNDLWVNGVSPDYAISVWYGYKEITPPYTSTSYSIGHRRLFQAAAKEVFKKGSDWTKPDGVVEVTIENETYPAQLPSEYTPEDKKITELFKKGSEPTEVSKKYSKLDSVSNLKATVSGNTLNLTWNAVTAYPLDENNINKYVDSLYQDANTNAAAKRNILNANKSFFGNLIYKIYSVDEKGEKTLLGTTDKTNYSTTITNTSITKYAVVTSYSSFIANASDPKEVSISLNGVKPAYELSLNGDATITIDAGTKYVDKGVKVTLNSKDISSKANIKTTIKDENNKDVKTIDTSKAGKYTITYRVTYDKVEKSINRTVIVKSKEPEKTEEPEEKSNNNEKTS